MESCFSGAWIVGLRCLIIKYIKYECMVEKFRFAEGRMETLREKAIAVLLMIFVIVEKWKESGVLWHRIFLSILVYCKEYTFRRSFSTGGCNGFYA